MDPFTDLFKVLQSFFEGVKVVNPNQGAVRLLRGVPLEKRLRNSKVRLREEMLNDIYEKNMIEDNLDKYKLETILTKEREEMIQNGKLKPDKEGVAKKPWEKGRTSLLKTWNPFYRPDYSDGFRKSRWGQASHNDRYTKILPPGAWTLIPERYFGIM